MSNQHCPQDLKGLDGLTNTNFGVPDWQDGSDETAEVLPTTNDAMGFTVTYVRPSETVGDVAKRCYGANNVVTRQRLLLANGGELNPGYIQVPR